MTKSQNISDENLLKIEEYLHKNYLDYKDLAEKLGIDRTTLYYIRKKKTTSTKTLRKLKELGIID